MPAPGNACASCRPIYVPARALAPVVAATSRRLPCRCAQARQTGQVFACWSCRFSRCCRSSVPGSGRQCEFLGFADSCPSPARPTRESQLPAAAAYSHCRPSTVASERRLLSIRLPARSGRASRGSPEGRHPNEGTLHGDCGAVRGLTPSERIHSLGSAASSRTAS